MILKCIIGIFAITGIMNIILVKGRTVKESIEGIEDGRL